MWDMLDRKTGKPIKVDAASSKPYECGVCGCRHRVNGYCRNCGAVDFAQTLDRRNPKTSRKKK